MRSSCWLAGIVGALGATAAFGCGESDGGGTGGAAATASGGLTAGGGIANTSGGGGATASGGRANTSGGASNASGGTPSPSGGTSNASGGTSNASGGTSNASGGTSSPSAGGPSGGAGESSVGPRPSTGCGTMTNTAGLVIEGEIEAAGTARGFLLSMPENYDPNHPYPLVFAWHGLGGSASLARSYFRIEQQAKGEALFVYPQGLPNDDGAAAWDLAVDGADVALFDALVEELGSSFCVDRARVFSTGHSFGGFMTARLGCSRASVLRAVAPVAGGPPFGGGSNCSASIPAWVTHGSNDATVDFDTGENGRDLWLAANGCDSTTRAVAPEPCVEYAGCEQPVHWCVHDQGHDWPSFAAAGIWSFFSMF